MPAAGDIYIHWHQAKKEKFLICIDDPQNYYMVINTDPWASAPANSQLRVTPQEVSCLQHASHINTAQLVRVDPLELNVLASAPHRHKGPLSTTVKDTIKATV